MSRLRELFGRGLAAWRRLGPRQFATLAAQAAAARVRLPLRRARIRLAPLRARPAAVRHALGGTGAVEALRGSALAALPSVADWERELDGLDGAARADLLARADAVAAHRFDLLGSGPVELGARIDWHADFKTGRRWPAVHISRVPITHGDGSDIKVPWELGRCQHLPLLAAAHRISGERRYLDELGRQLDSFVAANPVETGVQWACTMDVAIRAANWIAALALCAEAAAEQPWLERALAALYLHGRFIRSHLEWGEVRGNHYLADVAGLLALAGLFRGRGDWADWAVDELAAEMRHQVREDGSDHEASLPYHRLVCELFVCATQAADALRPGRLPDWYRERLDRMLELVAGTTRPDGLAPLIGDDDSGRYLPLGGYGADPRSHRHLFAQARRAAPAPRGSAAYPDGGWFVLRADDLYVIVRCGDVGLYGLGAHAHNDQLSFELCLGAQPLVVDPGSGLYTADPALRNRLRSTASHATLRIDGREQNKLRSDYLFAMEDRARAAVVESSERTFAGRHVGFAPAVHERHVELRAPTLLVRDTVRSPQEHLLEWSFPLAPGARVSEHSDGARAEWDGATLELRAPGLEWSLEQGSYAPAYGVIVPSPVLRARRRSRAGGDSTEIALTAERR